MSGLFSCRVMQVSDLDDVLRIQSEAYLDEMVESGAIIAARLDNVPDTCWVVEGEQGVCGYLVGYLSHKGAVTPWGSEFAHKRDADHLYLHDLAISKSAAGCGLGPLLVNHALLQAKSRRLVGAALVSVQDSRGFWQKMGFNEFVGLTPAQQQHLDSYTGPAFYMTQGFAINQ
ncbi:GNAT family N-acetyltransferase [Cellvibrio sp. KY-GH-1]|uniref:GNAT family N-acetyltransferase n=1 Tax=Cellvibrio sp. KY-GH-1 TaxID=2303332 RepID=UPI001CDA1408|nr:GNAT family N-acetyltransferase [Cellvibrio sp. KY-GH-1]